ncbi:hypothetical protein GA0115244_115311 [Streptomyces sp. DvalAA-19]|nr:hypothetical protein GA0115244_115311 [Streptomyces sp. DvalAA-19]
MTAAPPLMLDWTRTLVSGALFHADSTVTGMP